MASYFQIQILNLNPKSKYESKTNQKFKYFILVFCDGAIKSNVSPYHCFP